jgi:hypothetical protein
VTYYVERQNGAIVGAYRVPQPGYAEEEIADDDPEVVAFLNPTESDEQRVQRLASQAVMDTLARAATDPFAAAVVALFDVAFTLINDERELRGAPRLMPDVLFPLAIQAIVARQGGGGAPSPPPPP